VRSRGGGRSRDVRKSEMSEVRTRSSERNMLCKGDRLRCLRLRLEMGRVM
jgi:hypothetical protein